MRKLLLILGLLMPVTAAAEVPGLGGYWGLLELGGGGFSVGGDVDLNGTGQIIYDADADSYCESVSDDVVNCYAGGNKTFFWNTNTLDASGASSSTFKVPAAGRIFSNNARLAIGFSSQDRFLFANSGETTYWYVDSSGVFDNLTGTSFTFNDDLIVTGNQTYFGSMDIDTTQTVTISVAATPVQVTGFAAGDDLNGTSVATNELTVTNAGVYKITASVSSSKASGGSARGTKGYVYLDDGTPAAIPSCIYSRTLSSSNDVGNANIECIATLAASDKLELWLENTDGTENIEVAYATVVVLKL